MDDARPLAVEYWPIARLRPSADNPRTHPADQIGQVVASIGAFGWTSPILADPAGEIIAGEARLAAARIAGLAEVPVVVLRGLSAVQRRAYRIADNRIPLGAAWDEALLARVLAELDDASFDLQLTGFSDRELDDLFAALRDDEACREEILEPPAEPRSAAGALYQLGTHRLLCGDSTSAAAVAKLLSGAAPHLMVTDPPYGVMYDPSWRAVGWTGARSTGAVRNDDRADWREAWALFPGAVAYVWHGGLHAAVVAGSLAAAGFAVRAQIVWVKQHFAISRGHYHWQHEPCWYAVRKGGTGAWAGRRDQTTVWREAPADHWCGDARQSTVWEIANASAFGGQADDGKTIHSTQKPVECMRRPIVNNSRRGDAVYEPFAGSGSTVMAAEMTGRRCYAMELDPAYCDVIVARWEKHTGKRAERLE